MAYNAWIGLTEEVLQRADDLIDVSATGEHAIVIYNGGSLTDVSLQHIMASGRIDWDLCATHMAAIRATPLFNNLIVAIREEIPAFKIRQCLSHHTTASCRKDGAPVPSSGMKGLGLN